MTGEGGWVACYGSVADGRLVKKDGIAGHSGDGGVGDAPLPSTAYAIITPPAP
jgi:hypothetical protein